MTTKDAITQKGFLKILTFSFRGFLFLWWRLRRFGWIFRVLFSSLDVFGDSTQPDENVLNFILLDDVISVSVIKPKGPVKFFSGRSLHRHGKGHEEFPERNGPSSVRVKHNHDVLHDEVGLGTSGKYLRKELYQTLFCACKINQELKTRLASKFGANRVIKYAGPFL